jgi:hypothetical protein
MKDQPGLVYIKRQKIGCLFFIMNTHSYVIFIRRGFLEKKKRRIREPKNPDKPSFYVYHLSVLKENYRSGTRRNASMSVHRTGSLFVDNFWNEFGGKQ